jgi:hypothetical protein
MIEFYYGDNDWMDAVEATRLVQKFKNVKI